MAISRVDLLNQLLPGLNALFDIEYTKHTNGLMDTEQHMVEVEFDGQDESKREQVGRTAKSDD